MYSVCILSLQFLGTEIGEATSLGSRTGQKRAEHRFLRFNINYSKNLFWPSFCSWNVLALFAMKYLAIVFFLLWAWARGQDAPIASPSSVIASSSGSMTAKIVSCHGRALVRFPQLQSWLLDGEAEYYQGVAVEYINEYGRLDSTMIIYRDGVEQERVDLTTFAHLKDEMHDFMIRKGFIRKPQAIIERNDQIVRQRRQAAALVQAENERKVRDAQKNHQEIVLVTSIRLRRRVTNNEQLPSLPDKELLDYPVVLTQNESTAESASAKTRQIEMTPDGLELEAAYDPTREMLQRQKAELLSEYHSLPDPVPTRSSTARRVRSKQLFFEKNK